LNDVFLSAGRQGSGGSFNVADKLTFEEVTVLRHC
jgi:hypothetical protein